MWAAAVRRVRENVGDRIRDAGLTAAEVDKPKSRRCVDVKG